MKKIIGIFITIAMLGTAAFAMSEQQSVDEANAQQRAIAADRATTEIPAYVPQNYLRRQAVSELMQRQDTPDKTWYVYLHARGTGSILGYYVASTPPIPYCTAMTPTDQVVDRMDGDVVTGAPSLDGVYGGSDCETRFFFDAETSALVMSQMPMTILDQPLAGVEAPKLTVEASTDG